MNKKFDIETAKKLLTIYAENVNYYLRENQFLKSQLEDNQTSLELNKELLFKELNRKFGESNIIESLKKENERISKIIQKLYMENFELEKKYLAIKEKLDNILIEKNNIFDIQSTEIFKLKNKLIEKDNIIKNLNKELDKFSRDEDIIKEIIVIKPDKNNVEINNELVETRQILNKYTQLLHKEKQKNDIQEKRITFLLETIDNLKKKKKIKERMENIEMFDYILTSSSISDENSNQNHSLESPVIKFPEKIKQKRCLTTDIYNYKKKPPKLDFSKLLLEKYPPIKQIKVIDGIRENSNNNNDNDNEYIEKIKFQLKFFKNSTQELQKQNNDLKKIVSVLKKRYLNLKNSIIFNSNSTQETEKEKFNLLKINNINSKLIKKNNKDDQDNNLSMEVNSSQIDIDSICDESDFNYIIKEYNKNINNN